MKPRPPTPAALCLALCCLMASGCRRFLGRAPSPAPRSGQAGSFLLLSTDPLDGQRGVGPLEPLRLRFNRPLQAGAQRPGAVRVLDGEGRPHPGRLTQGSDQELLFEPSLPWREATDYRVSLSAFLFDRELHILDREPSFGFRSFDRRGPELLEGRLEADGRTLSLRFDEELLWPGKVELEDGAGKDLPSSLEVEGDELRIHPLLDPVSPLRLRIPRGGVQDLAGNPLDRDLDLGFHPPADTLAPELRASNLQEDRLPRGAALLLLFSESLHPSAPGRLCLLGPGEGAERPAARLSEDGRILFVRPEGGWRGERELRLPPGTLRDRSGNLLASAWSFRIRGLPSNPAPRVLRSHPSALAEHPPYAPIEIFFDQDMRTALGGRILGGEAVRLKVGGTRRPVRVDWKGRCLRIRPLLPLPPKSPVRLELSAASGVLIRAEGDPLQEDFLLDFRTGRGGTEPLPAFHPPGGSRGLPRDLRPVVLFPVPLDGWLTPESCLRLLDPAGREIPSDLDVGLRSLRLRPRSLLPPDAALTLELGSGSLGPRFLDGGLLARDRRIPLGTGGDEDEDPPDLGIRLEGIPPGTPLLLSTRGFALELRDLGGTLVHLDPSSFGLELRQVGGGSGIQIPFWRFLPEKGDWRLEILGSDGLEPGGYDLSWKAADLSGNRAIKSLRLELGEPAVPPFPRLQLVLVRFDGDRGGVEGLPDFREDLYDFGLLTREDPLGWNALLQARIQDEILAAAHAFFRRGPTGTPGRDSLPVRLVIQDPAPLPRGSFLVGGSDPLGRPGRRIGSPPSGVLGRAPFDYGNSDFWDGEGPGYGVFPRELLFWQAELWTTFGSRQPTDFARTFRGLAPWMGGTPAGAHPLDAKVLDPAFDPEKATPGERARFEEIEAALRELAQILGNILAHEIGHAVGLVAEGPPFHGLHGDQSLHVQGGGAFDLMIGTVGYLQLRSPRVALRPMNAAYLRESLLLR